LQQQPGRLRIAQIKSAKSVSYLFVNQDSLITFA